MCVCVCVFPYIICYVNCFDRTVCTEYLFRVNTYHVSTQGIGKCMINVHHYYCDKSFVATNTCLSGQTQLYHDKSFVATSK